MDKHIYKQYLVWLSLGTILEWFDFSLYGILAIRMSKVFFSTANPHAFLLTLLTFGVAFISRPIGALFFGYFGDKSSKYYSVNYSILVMASATFLIGVTPTYGSIGWIAPILLMIIRFTQGISLGGQFTGLMTIIVENKQLNKTFLIGICNSIALLGFLIAYLVGLLISFLETSFISQTWIWRLPYLSSILIFGFYLYIQPRKDFIHDHFNNTPLPSQQSNSLVSSLISQYSEMIFAITISISFGTLYYLYYVYSISYLQIHQYLKEKTAFLIMIIIIIMSIALFSIFGYMANKVKSRLKTTIILSFISFFIAGVNIITTSYIIEVFFTLLVIYCIIIAYSNSIVSEIFGQKYRMTASSLTYSIGLSISGFSPFLTEYLCKYNKNGLIIILQLSYSLLLFSALGIFSTKGYKLAKQSGSNL